MTNSIRIVLAEDDASLLESVNALLRAEGGFTVMGRSTDTVRAVQLADQQKPDLVILDLTMPLMNGIEATRRMRTLLPSTRLLVLSAQTAPTYVGSALKAGADGYITKDSLAGELVAAIRAVLAGQGYVSQSLRIFC
jgi:two-component system, NarL family, nitrate/nitrite response regulator NarL